MRDILLTEVNINMNKMNATWAFFFLYLVSPIIAIKNGESMEETHQKLWLELNKEEDK